MYIKAFLPLRSYILEVHECVRKCNCYIAWKLNHKTPLGLTVTRTCPKCNFAKPGLKQAGQDPNLQTSFEQYCAPRKSHQNKLISARDMIHCSSGDWDKVLSAENMLLQYFSFFCIVPYVNDLAGGAFWPLSVKGFLLGPSQFIITSKIPSSEAGYFLHKFLLISAGIFALQSSQGNKALLFFFWDLCSGLRTARARLSL